MRVFTRFLLVVLAAKFDLLAFENKKKYRAYVRFHENGPYGKIPTKKEPIRTLGFTSRLSCHIIMVLARVLNKISMTWTSGLICSKLHISYYWWISSSKCSPIGYYSSPLIFFPILIGLNWLRDAIVFIRGHYQPIVPVRGNTRMDRSRPRKLFSKQAELQKISNWNVLSGFFHFLFQILHLTLTAFI